MSDPRSEHHAPPADGPGSRPRLAPGAPAAHRAAPATNPDPDDAKDRALLDLARAGSRDALAKLLGRHQGRIHAVCRRMTRNPDRADDLTQEALLKVIRGLDRFSGRSKLSTWIVRVTMNVCLTDARREKHRRHASLDRPGWSSEDGEGSGADFLADQTEPSAPERVQQSEEQRLLARAMARLEPEQRALLILRDLHDVDYADLADHLGVPVGTVKSRLFRARAALRGHVESLEGTDPS